MPDGPVPDGPQPGRLGPADAGEVLTLQRAGYVTEAQLHDDPRLPPLIQTLEELTAELSDPAVIALGIREAGRLVASLRLRPAGRATVELARLVVAPDRQGQGLGTRLLQAAEARVPAGTSRIVLFTGEFSLANLRLYRRHGYQETGRSPAGSYHVVHLAKEL